MKRVEDSKTQLEDDELQLRTPSPAQATQGEMLTLSAAQHQDSDDFEANPFVFSMEQPSYVYLWGSGGWGALGMGGEDDDDDYYDEDGAADSARPTLLRNPALDGLQLRQIVCTKRHTLFLTGCGRVFACGSNVGVELAHDEGRRVVARPEEVKLPQPAVGRAFELASGNGYNHRFLLCSSASSSPSSGSSEAGDTQVYCWGESTQGQLFFNARCVEQPRLVESLQGLDVVQVATGDRHSLNGDGQLGLGDSVLHGPGPHPVIGLDGFKVVQIACGESHSVALTDAGTVYTWGNGLSGQLGHCNESSVNRPQLVQACLGMKVLYIACGSYHTVALIDTGDVVVWGSNEESQLGIEGESGQGIIAVACGTGLTVALSADGRVFACGMLLERIPIPRVVLPAGKGITQIACGAQYIAAWRGPLSPSLAGLRARISRAVDPNSWLALSALIDRDECSDLLLRLGDGSAIHAHRVVLAMRSDSLSAELVDLEAAPGARHCRRPGGAHHSLPAALGDSPRGSGYLYCDTLPPLPATLFVLHRRQKLAVGDDSDSDVEDVVGQLLHLARLYATKPLEDLLEKMVAFPRLAAAAALDAPSPVSNTLASDLLAAFEQPLFSDLSFIVTPSAATADDGAGYDEVAKNESGDKEMQKNEDAHADEKIESEEAQANEHPVAIEIVAHKCLLAPRSDYFRAMFLTGLKEATQRRVPIAGLRPEVFRQVVRYHYSGFVGEIDPEQVVELFVVGNEFGMDALVRPCERMIERGLDLDNVNDLWGMATTFASEQLKQLCIAFLLKQLRPKKIGTGRVAALSLELLEAVCARMIATPDSNVMNCGSCKESITRLDEREMCPHCVLCGRVLCQRWKKRGCIHKLLRHDGPPQLLRLFSPHGKSGFVPGVVQPLCHPCRAILSAHGT
ncbi:BTB/POZ domain containing protein [Acanthamoeba castellanii str. Neff]|uniref:BTB/POZ domain containing protein n=1 Tax=Acanthamoeba castellanii (strain ATCC 30010 / Neff) TaxID=1257118 RepID=L8HG90_ACACF|nr:BTB/POZ domain containing protein [Acanthamoeba castellanii str. Neff]ELR24272.1 BTB/POZ domain containing protein [Acanthamoeba castellanii str. Neff]